MRNIYIFLFLSCLGLSSQLWGQNANFLAFGLTLNEVQAELAKRDFVVDQQYYPDSDSLWISFPDEAASYLFENGTLYSIRYYKHYPDKKIADPHVQSVLHFFDLRKARVHKLNGSSGEDQYVMLEEDMLMLLTTRSQKKSELVSVELQATSRRYGPRTQTEALVTKVSKNY